MNFSEVGGVSHKMIVHHLHVHSDLTGCQQVRAHQLVQCPCKQVSIIFCGDCSAPIYSAAKSECQHFTTFAETLKELGA